MSTSKGQVRIQLTPEQKEQVLKATGKDVEEVELQVMELEERIAPATNAWPSKVVGPQG